MRTLSTLIVLAASGVTASAQQAPALGGACPVCLYEMEKVVPGKEEFSARFDRQTFYFPSAKEKAMFEADPIKYAPALAGDCAACLTKMGKRVPGKAEFSVKHAGRVYLFPSAKERDMFAAAPEKFAPTAVAYRGYCPVCLLDGGKLMAGKKEFASAYDGMLYYAAGAAAKAKFDADPAKYAPVMGGNCVVCREAAGETKRGSLKYGAFYKGRSYLLASEKARGKFLAEAAKFAEADVANGGNCVVCKKMMGRDMPGKPEFTSVYKGMRYRFPSAKEKATFEADPAKFVTAGPEMPDGGLVSITGTTACAACSYGRTPVADPASMGIAVVTPGKVYIVERGEAKYPQLFRDRFSSLNVTLTGKPVKAEGKFVWVEPTGLARK